MSAVLAAAGHQAAASAAEAAVAGERSCLSKLPACCKGPELMELDANELSFMKKGGNYFVQIASPEDHDREDVLYPTGVEILDDPPRLRLLAAKGHENEPLAAGLGRYMLMGKCGYLKTKDNGWEYCSVYDQRPKVCQNFEEGGDKCRIMRVQEGVDEPSEEYPDLRQFLEG